MLTKMLTEPSIKNFVPIAKYILIIYIIYMHFNSFCQSIYIQCKVRQFHFVCNFANFDHFINDRAALQKTALSNKETYVCWRGKQCY